MKGQGHRVRSWADASRRGLGVILPKDRDSRFVTIRRGGTLTDSDHQLLALWAASCAAHGLDLFESAQPEDPRPRRAIELGRAWAGGEITMTQSRTAAAHAMASARDLSGAARPAPGGNTRAGTRRPAVAERHLLVGVRLLRARRGASTAQQAHQCVRGHAQRRGERRRERHLHGQPRLGARHRPILFERSR